MDMSPKKIANIETHQSDRAEYAVIKISRNVRGLHFSIRCNKLTILGARYGNSFETLSEGTLSASISQGTYRVKAVGELVQSSRPAENRRETSGDLSSGMP